MKRIFILCFMMCLLTSNALATVFVNGFEDIPLADGFRQIDNLNFSFGNEDSGYTEAIILAKKGKTFNDVILFYIETLPKLGWNLKEQSKTNLIFIRDNSILEISVQKIRPLKVSISLKNIN